MILRKFWHDFVTCFCGSLNLTYHARKGKQVLVPKLGGKKQTTCCLHGQLISETSRGELNPSNAKKTPTNTIHFSESEDVSVQKKKKKKLKTSKDYNFFTLWMNSHVSVRQTTWIKSKGQNVKLVSQSQVVEEAEEVEEEDSWGGVFFFKTSLSLSLWIVESWKRKKKQASHDVLDWSNVCQFFFFRFFTFCGAASDHHIICYQF